MCGLYLMLLQPHPSLTSASHPDSPTIFPKLRDIFPTQSLALDLSLCLEHSLSLSLHLSVTTEVVPSSEGFNTIQSKQAPSVPFLCISILLFYKLHDNFKQNICFVFI
jgi:hypothetical protein